MEETEIICEYSVSSVCFRGHRIVIRLNQAPFLLRAYHFSLLTGFNRVIAGRPYERHRVRRLHDDYSNGTISSATMLMILISGLIAGPAVSL